MPTLRRPSGFTLLGIVISIAIVGAMSLALPMFMATNQNLRTQQMQIEQAFYASQAAIEYMLELINEGHIGCTLAIPNFFGHSVQINRTGGKIFASATVGDVTRSYSVTDPLPPTAASCFNVDVSGGSISSGDNKLQGINFVRIGQCDCPITIVSMTNSWTPDANEKVTKIRVDGSLVYNYSPGLPSGSTEVFDSPQTILTTDFASHALTDIQFQKKIDDVTTFTLVFNMSDGSSSTANFSP